MVKTIASLAQKNQKLFAITETGLETVSEENWWSKILVPIVANTGLSYVLVWRNGRPDHYYAPFKGQKTEKDFLKTLNSGVLLLETDFKLKP
jgi:mannan endo-1,4-beta-mannosidase